MSMYNLPHRWVNVSLRDLGSYINGRAFKPSEWKKEGLPIIRIQNLNNPEANFNYSNKEHECKYRVKSGDLLVAWSASLGVFIWHRGDAWLNQHIFRVEVNKPTVTKEFLYYAIKQAIDELYKKTHGTGMVHVTKPVFESHQVSVPPLNEQHRIVAKLEKLLQKVDACKERLDKIPTILKRFRQSILAAACSGHLTADWREKHPDVEPASLLLKQIREEREKSKSEPFGKGKSKRGKVRRPSFEYLESNQPDIEIPLSWKWCRITDLIKDLTDYHANGSYETLKQHVKLLDQPNYAFMIRATNFVKNDFSSLMKYITKDAYEFLSKSKLFGEEILVGKIGNAGDVYYMPVMNHPCSLGMNLFALRFPQLVNSRYIYFHLKTDFSSKEMKSYIKGATNQSIDKKSVRSIWIACPPKREQQEVIRRVEALFKVADQIEERYKKARTYVDKLTQSILAKAFRGELVPQDPSDEPASKLLKRIKEEKAKTETKVKPTRHRGKWKTQVLS